jgi:hypothetical protein
VGEFSAGWLALREGADAAARSADLTSAVAERLATPGGELSILDLATGTGSNLRYLAERLPSPQRWRMADRDPHLLAQILPRVSAWATSRGATVCGSPSGAAIRGSALACRIEVRRVDLARLRSGDVFDGCALVTASALLDLVSARWLDELAARCRDVGAVVLFALTYDGRWSCTPGEPEDDEVRHLVNRHQHVVKGFGRALGPAAVDHAVQAFRGAGYEVRSASSDWRLPPSQGPLQRQLIEGWASAAVEIAPDRADPIERWRAHRLAHVQEGVSHVVVGHKDLAGWIL